MWVWVVCVAGGVGASTWALGASTGAGPALVVGQGVARASAAPLIYMYDYIVDDEDANGLQRLRRADTPIAWCKFAYGRRVEQHGRDRSARNAALVWSEPLRVNAAQHLLVEALHVLSPEWRF